MCVCGGRFFTELLFASYLLRFTPGLDFAKTWHNSGFWLLQFEVRDFLELVLLLGSFHTRSIKRNKVSDPCPPILLRSRGEVQGAWDSVLVGTPD